MTPGRRFALAAVAVVLVVAWVRSVWWPGPLDTGDRREPSSVVDFLTAGAEGEWAQVTRGRALAFPRDHGPHPDYRQEWWYYTGNLRAADGRRFGFQLTFFRFGHGAFEDYAESAWRSEHSWMAHFAVSDVEGRRLYAWQDYARGALGLAGARAEPFGVWVNSWSVRAGPGGGNGFSARLAARSEGAGIRLELAGAAPPLLQGEQGYSAKDAGGDTASYYYSLPNLAATGTLRIGEETFDVSGRAWMDREWSTEVLSKDQLGWDWFALRLDNGDTLMVFQVRRDDGRHFRYAVHVEAGGATHYHDSAGVVLEPTSWWQSATTAARYPIAWRLRIEPAAVDLTVSAAFRDQELSLDFAYWEGVVDVAGRVDNGTVRGEGYMELTGY